MLWIFISWAHTSGWDRRQFRRKYYRVIIDNHIPPFIHDIHGGTNTFVLQEGKCEPHRALSIAMQLSNEEVRSLKWPAQSPDLNLIENVWGLMNSHLCKRNVHPNNPKELFHILSTMWNILPDNYFHNLIASMQKRVALLQKNMGCLIKYQQY